MTPRSFRAASIFSLLLALPVAGALRDPGHSPAPPTVRADVALVLSGDVDYLRVARASLLYQTGAVSAILVTGSGVGGDSADALREECLHRGVPADRILLETRSVSTRENIAFVAPLIEARGFRRVALVTSASHMGRAERTARRIMPKVEWIPVPVEDAGPRSRIYVARLQEWGKLLWYAARGWV